MDGLKRRLGTVEEKINELEDVPDELPSIVNSGKETRK